VKTGRVRHSAAIMKAVTIPNDNACSALLKGVFIFKKQS